MRTSLIFGLNLLLLSVLWSCSSLRQEVDPSLLGVQSTKLVVTSFLSPQDSDIAVKVTRSATVIGDSVTLQQTGNSVNNATVTLTEGGKSVTLIYNNIAKGDTVASKPYYSFPTVLFPIQVGHTYTLTVTTPAGERATATCTIPQPVTPAAVMLDSASQRYSVRATWNDPAGQANYYQVTGVFRYIASNCKSCQTETSTTLSFNDDGNQGFVSDAGQDGTLLHSSRAYLTSGAVKNFYNQYKSARVIVDLMSVDAIYYQFQTAVIKQRQSRNNPFAEPVLIPSNVLGGLGCFAGYNNATITLKLK